MVYVKIMGYSRLILPVVMLSIFLFSCASKPQEIPKEDVPVTAADPVKTEESFDLARVSREQYDSTMEEVKQFIEELNKVIRNKNYEAWKAALSSEYFAEISSPENLQRVSEQPAMKTRKITLKTPKDYFEHVVVPSRANSHVDDIEFISRNRVKAFSLSTNAAGEELRLRLYDLEKIGNSWTIIN